jgi:predicted nucleic acid-binding protein
VVIADANVAVKWCVREPLHADARSLLAAAEDLVPPAVIVTEVADALRRKVTHGASTLAQALDALEILPRCFARLVPCAETLRIAFGFALELVHPFPDCAYLACAVMNDASLITDDRKFHEKAVSNGHGGRIFLLADWMPRQQPRDETGG